MSKKRNRKNNGTPKPVNPKYVSILKETLDDLQDVGDKVFDRALHLALNGDWSRWEKSMAIGTTVTFNENMLMKSEDKIVKNLTKLRLDISNISQKIRTYLDKRAATEASGIFTGHKVIDKATGGLKNGDVVALTGSASKDTALKVIAKVSSEDGVNCGIFSFRNNKGEIVRKMMALVSGVGAKKIKKGNISSRDWSKLLASSNKISTSPIYVREDISSSEDILDSIAEAKDKLGLLILDGYNETIPVKSLKSIATSFKLPIVVTTRKPSKGFDKVVRLVG